MDVNHPSSPHLLLSSLVNVQRVPIINLHQYYLLYVTPNKLNLINQMGCNSSMDSVSPLTPFAQSRRKKTLNKLPQKHQFHLRKQNPPHGTTSNSRITDIIIKNKQISNSEFKEEFGRAKALNSKYSDSEFPATEESLGGSYKQSILWKSPEEFIEGEVLMFSQGISIKQNKSISHYFASALSIAREHPEILKRLFENTEVNQPGLYGIWLCVDSWKCVVVDDRIPVDGEQPYFTSSGNEITIPLLQKAYAKALGGYSRIQSGLFGPCMTSLTGCPYEYFNKSSKIEQSPDEMWDFINAQMDKGNIVVVSNQSNDRNQTLWGKPEYSYIILQTTSMTIKGNKERLLKVANPWHRYDWTGRWSLKSKTWTADLKSKLNYDDSQEYFWINIDDLSENFRQACSCRYQKESIYSFCKLQFEESKKNQFKGIFLTVDTKNKGYLTVSQKDHRAFEKTYKYGLVRLVVCEINREEGYLTRYITDYLDSTQNFTVELDLDIGNYYIAIECSWLDWGREIVVSYYGSHGVHLIEDNDLPKNTENLINEMILLHEKCTDNEKRRHVYAGDQNISRVTGSLAGYIYYHYSNNSTTGRCLQESVLLKQKQYIKVDGGTNPQEFNVKVEPGEDLIMRLKVDPEGNGFYSYSTKIQFHLIESYSLQKLKQLCEKNPTKTKKREIDGKTIEVIVKTYSYSGGIALLYQNKMDKYAFVEQLTVEMDNLVLQNDVMNQNSTIDVEIEPRQYKLLSFLIDKPGEKVSFKTNMSFYLNTPEFQF